jgi:hypothetical protein
VKRLVAHVKDGRLKLLLGWDANSHYELCGSTDINLRGESLLDFIEDTEMHVLSRRTERTVLDLRNRK